MLLKMIQLVYLKNQGFIKHLTWFELYVYAIFLRWLFVLVFMTFINKIVKWTFKKDISWIYRIFIHLLLSISLFYFVFSLNSLHQVFFGSFTIQQALKSLSFESFMLKEVPFFLIYFALVGIIHTYHYIQKLEKIEQQKSQIQIQLAHSEMRMLKTQIQPSFIFNTLKSILNQIQIDEKKSQDLISDFGDLFRTIIEYKDSDFIILEKELQLLEKFNTIASIRYPNGFTYCKSMEKGLENILVPNMLLQPIQENLLKNFSSKKNLMVKVQINIYKQNNHLYIHLKNSGEFIKLNTDELLIKEMLTKTLHSRLQSLYKDNYQYNCTINSNEILTEIRIPI